MSSTEERARGGIGPHKYYSLWLLLARVGVLALLIPAVLLLQFYKPSYSTVDVIVMLAIGMILGAVYVESQEKLAKHYTRRSDETGKKTTNDKST